MRFPIYKLDDVGPIQARSAASGNVSELALIGGRCRTRARWALNPAYIGKGL